MNTGIAGEFRMERCREQVALAGGDDTAVIQRADGGRPATYLLDDRRADEDGVERGAGDTFDV